MEQAKFLKKNYGDKTPYDIKMRQSTNRQTVIIN